MPGEATLVWNQAELAVLLRSTHGVVGKDLLRRCLRVETRAKMYATGYGGGPRVRTGRLRSSITHHIAMEGGGVVGVVGTNVEYAPFVELGTSRMRARPFLRPALAAAR